MVDATTSMEDRLPRGQDERRDAAAATGGIAQLIDVAAYSAFADGRNFAPAQSPLWVSAWSAESGKDCFIVLARQANGSQIALPLEVSSLGPLKTARFMGNRHANGNFPPASAAPGGIDSATIVNAVRRLRPDIDLVLLERMTHSLAGKVNPLAHLPQQPSPNVSLAVNLEGGFDAMLGRSSGKRKRKKHRSQTRKFETAGQIKRIEASTPEEVNRVLESFFELKSARFRELGLPDVFADDATKAFFRRLFLSSLGSRQKPFQLHALEIAGKLRAITGSSRSVDRLICEFGAIANDDLAHASPGEFLFFENINEACARGFSVYDFSVGDEPYKRLWCDIEERQFDVRLATSQSGKVLGAVDGALASLKRSIKANPLLWPAIKRLRRPKPHSAAEHPDDD
jgi:CelD/BcsL family acetyltransferase involved in cellulose biosynthesis